jgi:hypothetical protein
MMMTTKRSSTPRHFPFQSLTLSAASKYRSNGKKLLTTGMLPESSASRSIFRRAELGRSVMVESDIFSLHFLSSSLIPTTTLCNDNRTLSRSWEASLWARLCNKDFFESYFVQRRTAAAPKEQLRERARDVVCRDSSRSKRLCTV